MRKLFYSLCLLSLFGLSSCLSETKNTQAEINDALLKEIGQSESYVTMLGTLEESHDIFMSMDRELYVKSMEDAGVGFCEVKEKGIPPALQEIKEAVEFLELMVVYCDAVSRFREAYPFYSDLSEEQRLRVVEYRNQAIGFEPADVLAKH